MRPHFIHKMSSLRAFRFKKDKVVESSPGSEAVTEDSSPATVGSIKRLASDPEEEPANGNSHNGDSSLLDDDSEDLIRPPVSDLKNPKLTSKMAKIQYID